MIKITEICNGVESLFLYELIHGNKITYSEKISCHTVSKKRENKTYLLIYDTNMKPISATFSYLNYELEEKALNTRIKSMQALKLLFVYEKIIGKPFSNFSTRDVTNLKHFLKGISPKGNEYTFAINTTRKNETINGYIGVYRSYAEFLNINIKALNGIKHTKLKSRINNNKYSTDIYKSNVPVPRKIIEVPWYISAVEYNKIINEIRSNHSDLEELIVRLMFECGLRIGEVLGLTSEDVLIEEIDNLLIPKAYIRNRLSDSFDQNAKTCMNITSTSDYQTNEYITEYYGYQKVVIPMQLYILLNDFIENFHLSARNKNYDNYFKYCIADTVTNFDNDENFYIFLNSQNRPLSSQLWNIKLRKIYSAVDIPIDKVKRTHNLNHRFRHGFAMFNVTHCGSNEIQLMSLMRHSSIDSVKKYYKPTTSDSIKIKTDFAEELYKSIPALRGDTNDKI